MAGMIDGLQGLGQRLLADGFNTPLLHIPMAYMNEDLNHIRTRLQNIYQLIQSNEIMSYENLDPIIIAFTGTGNVSKGAQEIFELLPHEYITVCELPTLKEDVKMKRKRNNILYGVKVNTSDYIQLKSVKDGNENKVHFDKKHYYTFPEQYTSTFHITVAPYITALVNGIYWDERYPRLLTKSQIRILYNHNSSLKAVIDISCDVNGSIEFLSRTTTIEKPFFSYIADEDLVVDEIIPRGIMMMGVDILPSELPKDASIHFGDCLINLLSHLLLSCGSENSQNMTDIPPEYVYDNHQ
jgi:alpha-aminoadipic semialdehyde synthase